MKAWYAFKKPRLCNGYWSKQLGGGGVDYSASERRQVEGSCEDDNEP